MLTTQIIRDTLKQAYAGSRRLRLAGYVTGDGQVIDYDVELLPETGYRDLVKQSLEQLSAGKVSRPADIPLTDWNQACEEQKASWQKSLAGESVRRGPVYTASAAGYYTDAAKPDTTVVMHLKTISQRILAGTAGHVVKSAAKTLAKKAIAKQCPINAFLGQLNLAPGKVQSITIL